DGGVVVAALGDRVVEYSRVRGEPGDRKLVDVALQRAARQQRACDVVQPDALADLVKLLGRFHICSLLSIALCEKVGACHPERTEGPRRVCSPEPRSFAPLRMTDPHPCFRKTL